MRLALDVTSFVEQLRGANGFRASEFERYSRYVSGLMPHLRRVSAPALRLKSDKHPFVFKETDLEKQDLGLAIVDDPLAQLVILEAERAYSRGAGLQRFLQSGNERLQGLNFQKLHRRMVLNFRRAAERADTLAALAEKYGADTIQMQSLYYKYAMQAAVQLEEDAYFEAATLLAAADEALLILQEHQIEQTAIVALQTDIKQQLSHAQYMAKAFAGEDEAILSQLEEDLLRERKRIRQMCAQRPKVMKTDDEKTEIQTLSLYLDLQQKSVQIVIPRGAAHKKIARRNGAAELSFCLADEMSQITDVLKAAHDEAINGHLQTVCVPGFFSRPIQRNSTKTRPAFQKLCAKLKVVRELRLITRAWLDRPRPVDPARLQHLHDVLLQEETFLDQFYCVSTAKTYQLGLLNGAFTHRANVKHCVERALCRELQVPAINTRAIAQIGPQSPAKVKDLAIVWYLVSMEKLAQSPETFKIVSQGAEIDFQVNPVTTVTQPVQQPAGQKNKPAQPPKMETITKIDPVKQHQLLQKQREKLLEHLFYLTSSSKAEPGFFDSIKYSDAIQSAFQVAKLRREINPEAELKGFETAGVIAPLLPAPAFFDAIPDELEFDDAFWTE